jgi:hypothetical protein
MRNDVSSLSDSVLAELSRQALSRSADRLGVDPCRLARSLRDGRIAEMILVLRQARSWAYPSDKQRIDELLEGIERDTNGPPERVRTDGSPAPGAGLGPARGAGCRS